VASLPHQINDGPVFFSLLEVIQHQSNGFVSSQTAREQDREQCSITLSL
jgi:hypothetical protein